MKCSSVYVLLVVLTVYLRPTHSICDEGLVYSMSDIIWNGIPPTNLISKLDGTWTVVKTHLMNSRGNQTLKCWQQINNAKKATSTDVFYVRGSDDPWRIEHDVFEDSGFVTRRFTTEGHSYSDYMYSLYSDQGVAAWYHCGHEREPFVFISVLDYATRKDDPETENAVRRAESVIASLGLEIPPELPTECPTVPADASIPAPLVQFHEPLDAEGLHTLQWTLDYGAQEITMEFQLKIQPSSWFFIGFSDDGTLRNGDFCMVWTDAQNISRFQDVWTDEAEVLHLDEQQDCYFQGHKQDNNGAVSVFSRKFDTCDDHHKVLEEGTMRVVWATGPGPISSPEGLHVSSSQHGSISTRLLRPLQDDPPLTRDVWTFDIVQDNFQVPKSDIYWCKQVQLPEALKNKHHIVKFESIVTPRNELLVHHMLLKQCDGPMTPSQGPCWELGFERRCTRLLAMGFGDFSFPQEAGFPLGGTDSPIYAVLEIHYTPDDTKDWVDSSGLRVHVTPLLRQYDADVLELGLEYRGETALPPGQRRFPVTSRCISSCTAISLPTDGITIFAARLHSHTSAVSMVTRHVRGGVELPEVVRDNHFDVHKQPLWRLRRNVKVLQGDELITTCWFDTTKRSNVTLTGVGTSDEMCLVIVYYYPKMNLHLCKSSVNEDSLNEYFYKTNGQVYHARDSIDNHIQNFWKISWTPENVGSLLHLYNNSPIDVQCLGLSNWRNLSVLPLEHPLPPPPRLCASKGHM